MARLRAGRIFFNLAANSTYLRANVPACDARCHVSRTRGLRCLRDALFAPDRLVGFFAQKNYRAYKPLPGMRRRGVEKRHAAEAFGQAPANIRATRCRRATTPIRKEIVAAIQRLVPRPLQVRDTAAQPRTDRGDTAVAKSVAARMGVCIFLTVSRVFRESSVKGSHSSSSRMRTVELRLIVGAGLVLEERAEAKPGWVVSLEVTSRRRETFGAEKSKLKKGPPRLCGGRGSHANNEECTCRSHGVAVCHDAKGTRSCASALQCIADRTSIQSNRIQGADASAQRLSRFLENSISSPLVRISVATRQRHRLSVSELRACRGRRVAPSRARNPITFDWKKCSWIRPHPNKKAGPA